MEPLRQYCAEVCFIDKLQTFVISPAKYDEILKDSRLLKYLRKSEEEILPFIKTARKIGTDKIYLAFIYIPAKVEKIQWMPIHCYKNGNRFYHVHYRNSWMCRECGNIMKESVIMPMAEADPVIYHLAGNRNFDLPLIFQKIKCPQCGKPLQNHLIVIDFQRKQNDIGRTSV